MRSGTNPNWCREFWMACSGWASIGMKARFTNRKERNCIAQRRRNVWPMEPHFCAIAPRRNMPVAITPNRRKTRNQRPPRRVSRCSCRDGKPSTPGVKPAVRFKVPLGETTKFLDAVFGEREFSNEEIEDFVLLRSGKGEEEFGQSMYQLGVVVDDIDMRITHVIRGADHL